MNKLFKGTYTALVTPFTDNNRIDWESLKLMVDFQINAGITGIVFLGTTGESPTITIDEHYDILRESVLMVNKRCQVIHGTGSNNTQTSIEHARIASEAGADGQLMVNPYYNKPTQKGLYEHFTRVADETDVPIILYNIMGRTGVNLETKTLLQLTQHPNIVAVKEASGDINQMMDVIRSVPSDFSVLVGDDAFTLPFMACGGDGVISVISNCVPQEMSAFINLCLKGDFVTARNHFYSLLDLMRVAFVETNPIPIKEIMAQLDFCKPNFRLPLCRAGEQAMQQIIKTVSFVKSRNFNITTLKS